MAKGKIWTEKEIFFLKNNYSKISIEDIAKELNRSIMSLKMQVSRKKMSIKRYKKQEIESKSIENTRLRIEKISLEIQEILKEHTNLNLYNLQREFYKKFIYHTDDSIKKAFNVLLSNDLIEYVENLKNARSKNFRLKNKGVYNE